MESCPSCGHPPAEPVAAARRLCPACGQRLPGPDDTMGIGGLDALLGPDAEPAPAQPSAGDPPPASTPPTWREQPPADRQAPPHPHPATPARESPPGGSDYAGRFPLFADGGRPSDVRPDAERDERPDHERTRIRPIAPGAGGETRAIPRQQAGPPPPHPAGRPTAPQDAARPPARPPAPAPVPPAGAPPTGPSPLPRTPFEGPLPWEIETPKRRRGPLLLALAVALVLAIVVAGGGWWLLERRDDGGSDTVAREDPPAATPTADPTSAPTGAPSSAESSRPPSSPGSPSESGSPSSSAAPTPTSLLAGVTIPAVPDPAPDSTDVDGEPVTFGAENMIDGDPSTAWRMTGSGLGEPIVLKLPEKATITRVGLVNGYAKEAEEDGEPFTWYDRNRRITRVEWVFDDRSRVTQRFDSTTEMQTIAVDPIVTRRVKIRIMGVSGVPAGGRDFTAISEVDLTGTPTGKQGGKQGGQQGGDGG